MLDKWEPQEELLREIASVGGRYGAKIEEHICQMKRISRAVSYLRLRLERSRGTPLFSMRLLVRLRKRFYELRERAVEQRRYLIETFAKLMQRLPPQGTYPCLTTPYSIKELGEYLTPSKLVGASAPFLKGNFILISYLCQAFMILIINPLKNCWVLRRSPDHT